MISYRNQMLDEAEALLNDGKLDEYNAKMEDIKTFDNEYEEYTTQKANIEALKGAVSIRNVLSDNRANEIVDIINVNGNDNDKAYRNAFMDFVLKGISIPQELKNENEYTTASDVSAVIPNTILDRIVEKIETTGKILGKVTRTFYKGGVTVPTSAAKPVATWTTERGKVDIQKKTTGSITFSYFKLKCVVGISLTVENVTLEVFERTVAANIAEAMVKALEKAIINGTGINQPTGILKATAPTKQNVNIAAGQDITYEDLCNAEGILPSEYDSAEWAMTKKTYFGQIVSMTDANGQPIARTNVGIDGKPAYTILGRPVNFVSSDDMADYESTVSVDTIVAFMFKFDDYILNTNMNVTVSHYDDNDTDDKMTKAIMLADGKVIDKNSLVTITKKKSA
ncbi:MAG: phage major capsid protein [Lachnospiraceae bacterium]|nr:phage major capsid protein [Lachnospiraceae bacterium]